jgi:signal transduction histidine kinase
MWTRVSLSNRIPRTLVRFAVALLVMALALLIRWALSPLVSDSIPYITLFPAIAFSAWFCGVAPTAVGAVLALIVSRYLFISPIHSLSFPDAQQSYGMVAFILASAVIIAIAERWRHEMESLHVAQGELEERVRERTAELDSANHSLRELTARLLQLQDDERRRFARELHDSVGQTLAALAMNLATAEADIEKLLNTARTLSDSTTMVQDMSKEIRTISHLLHPPLLDEAGLSSALRWYIQGFVQRSGIEVDLSLADDFGRLPRDLETTIFRVVQECLTNIHRHSGSPIAIIRLVRSEHWVRVEIQDKGKGIPQEKRMEMTSSGTLGVGIRGMRERVRQLGGTLDIESAENGKGTVIIARLPVENVSTSTTSTAAA